MPIVPIAQYVTMAGTKLMPECSVETTYRCMEYIPITSVGVHFVYMCVSKYFLDHISTSSCCSCGRFHVWLQ